MMKPNAAMTLPFALVGTGSLLGGVGIGLLISGANWFIGLLLLMLGLALTTVGAIMLRRAGAEMSTLSGALAAASDATLLPMSNPLPDASTFAPLGDDLTRIGHQMRHLVMQLQMQADQVRDVAVRIGEAATQQDHATTEQVSAVGQVAAAMVELDRIIASVTDLAHQVATAASQSLEATHSSEDVVGEVINSLISTGSRVNETVKAMVLLRERINQIGAASSLIAEVAHETHLLALNAAIEASAAGERGVRFAIVAEEIRSLASRTREGNEQVSKMVEELVDALQTAEEAAQAGLEQTSETSGMAITLNSTAIELTATARQTQQVAAAIDQAMNQQRIGATQVTSALASIADASRSMSGQSHAVASRVTELTAVADMLRHSALRFGRGRVIQGTMRLLIAGRETVSERGLAWQALVDSWNQAHPHNAVTIEFIPPSPDYMLNLHQAFAEGRAPDIAQVPGGIEINLSIDEGYLAPLDSVLSAAVRADFYPQLLTDSYEQRGTYWLPTEAQPLVMFYNKQLLRELDLEPPRTWEQLITLGERARPARWGLVLEAEPGNFRVQHWLPFVWQGGNNVTDANGNLQANHPAVRAALQLWRDLFVTHAVAPRKPTYPSYDIANLANGHCVMQYIGSWGINMMRESYPNFDYGIADLPLPAEGKPSTILLTWGLVVNAASANREVATEFVRWSLASEDEAGVARVRSLMVEGLPVRRSIVPLVTASDAIDPHWRYLLEQIYPHARIMPPLSRTFIDAADRMIEQAISAATG